MASPVLQAKRQADLLRRLLDDHAPDLVGKVFGLLQVRFGSMPIDLLVAISDDGVIQRTKKNPLPEVMKADQISERVKQLIAQHRKDSSPLNFKSDTSYTLSVADVDRIRIFLLEKHKPATINPKPAVASPEPVPVEAQPVEYSTPLFVITATTPIMVAPPTDIEARSTATPSGHACRNCGSAHFSIEYGRYGYYFKCRACDGNTPI